jgi:hypothetical protein
VDLAEGRHWHQRAQPQLEERADLGPARLDEVLASLLDVPKLLAHRQVGGDQVGQLALEGPGQLDQLVVPDAAHRDSLAKAERVAERELEAGGDPVGGLEEQERQAAAMDALALGRGRGHRGDRARRRDPLAQGHRPAIDERRDHR